MQYIDFIGKDGRPEGHVVLAMEVDAKWRGALKNCVKLANIRAKNKIWIHVTSSTEAQQNFSKALKEIQKLLEIREETSESFGNFIAFLKTPNPEDFQRVNLFVNE